MVEYLEELKRVRDEDKSPRIMFDESNCTALFHVFDRSNAGYISLAQYKEGTAFVNVCLFHLFLIRHPIISSLHFSRL